MFKALILAAQNNRRDESWTPPKASNGTKPAVIISTGYTKLR
jgi:hypothetical protein